MHATIPCVVHLHIKKYVSQSSNLALYIFYHASSLLSRYWTHAGLLSNFPLWSSQFPLFSFPQKTPMSRQTWYSISKWRNPKEYFSEFFITILSNYIKRDEITSFSFLIESWMVNSEPKLFESPNINIDFIHVCKLIKRKISAIWRSITKNVPIQISTGVSFSCFDKDTE